jgi:hypothetical protein
MIAWFKIALLPTVVKRSTKVSLVVGTLLSIVNHLDTILLMGINSNVVFKILFTYFVPYCVSTYASVSTMNSSKNTTNSSD